MLSALIILPMCSDDVILVCTDAAARGLDIPDVSHVVQAEFAASAVDFIHRVCLHQELSFLACRLLQTLYHHLHTMVALH